MNVNPPYLVYNRFNLQCRFSTGKDYQILFDNMISILYTMSYNNVYNYRKSYKRKRWVKKEIMNTLDKNIFFIKI